MPSNRAARQLASAGLRLRQSAAYENRGSVQFHGGPVTYITDPPVRLRYNLRCPQYPPSRVNLDSLHKDFQSRIRFISLSFIERQIFNHEFPSGFDRVLMLSGSGFERILYRAHRGAIISLSLRFSPEIVNRDPPMIASPIRLIVTEA